MSERSEGLPHHGGWPGPDETVPAHAAVDAPPAAAGSPRASRLHQPWRGLVAFAEVAFAALLVLVAMWAWQRGLVTMEFPTSKPGQPPYQVVRYVGYWIAAAVFAAALAGLVTIDAFRQTLLALRTGGRRRA